ncbi:MAG: hypothetical protein ACRDHZ_11790, partial [Ktedonobacteraceae bacterium]
GMVTLPLIYALQDSSSNGHLQRVQKLLSESEHDETEMREIIAWVLAGDNVARAFKDAYTYANKARTALHEFPVSPDRATMEEIIDFVVMRKR